MLNKVPDYCLGCTLRLRSEKEKKLNRGTEQLKRVINSIKNKRMNYEKDNFEAGYIQALLNYGTITSEQYEEIYNIGVK